MKTYRLTDYGCDATAHEENGFFVIHAGSRFGDIRNPHDRMMRGYRDFLSRNGAFGADGLTLRGDERLLYADEAARVVTGCLCDESSWIAEDGSRPTMLTPKWQRDIEILGRPDDPPHCIDVSI